MRARAILTLAAVSSALAVSPAAADFPRKAPRVSLVQVLAGARQALVLDRTSGEYQVVKVGDSVQGFRVGEIEEDQIVLASPAVPDRYFVLPLIEPTPVQAPAVHGPAESAPPAPAPETAPAAPDADVLDPYTAGNGDSSVRDPYDAASGIPSVMAPPASRVPAPAAPSTGVVDAAPPIDLDAAEPVAPDPGAPIDPGASPSIDPGAPIEALDDTAGPAPADSKVTTVKPTEVRPGASAPPPEQARKLSRRELDAALADFSALARQMRIERAQGGGVRILELERRSFFAKLGLERGDIVKRVAGLPIDTVDQAAAAYAAVSSSRDVLVEIERRGASLRIRYKLTK